jgi:hypothetical protein
MSFEKDAVERVTLDGKSIDATDATYEVVEDVVIGVAGVGDIVIRPQVKDQEAILKTVDRAKRALQAALEAADANNPTAARAAAARRREVDYQLESLRKEISRLTPGDVRSNLAPGLDALRVKIEELRGRRDTEMTRLALDTLPERATVEPKIRKSAAEAEQLAAATALARIVRAARRR